MTENKTVCGVGINDADYILVKYQEMGLEGGKRKRKVVWKCPFYMKWKSMLTRCYSEKAMNRRPTYRGCLVCDHWLRFSNFKKWMEAQSWEGKELDKDLLGNGKLYSPENCCFISKKFNTFLRSCGKDNKTGHRGVVFDKRYNKYVAKISNPLKPGENVEYIGHFITPDAAGKAWVARKNEIMLALAACESDIRVTQNREIFWNDIGFQ